MAEPAESGHHLIRDVEDLVGLADLEHALVIPLRRDDHATRAHDGFGDEGTDVLGADLLDALAEILDQPVAELGLGHALRAPVGVRAGDVHHHLVGLVESDLVVGDAGESRRHVGHAMVGIDPGDNLLLAGAAEVVPVEVNKANGRVVGHGTARAEEHVIEGSRCQGSNLGAEKTRRRGREMVEWRVVGNGADLFGDRLGHLLAAIADVDTPQSADTVDEPVAVAVVDMDAISLGHDLGTLVVPLGEIRPRMNDVVVVLLPQLIGVVPGVPQHGVLPSPIGPSFACLDVVDQSAWPGNPQVPADRQGMTLSWKMRRRLRNRAMRSNDAPAVATARPAQIPSPDQPNQNPKAAAQGRPRPQLVATL